MYLEDSRLIEASRKAVWEAITSETALAKCLPGCLKLLRVSDTELEGRLHQSIGLITATFDGKLTFENIRPLEGCRVIATGRSPSAGSTHCAIAVRLLEVSPNRTEFIFGAEATSEGPINELDEQVLASTAERIAGEFMDNLANEVQIANEAEDSAESVELVEDFFDVPVEAISLAPATASSGAAVVDEFGLAPASEAALGGPARLLPDMPVSDSMARPPEPPGPSPAGVPHPEVTPARSTIDIDDASLLPEGDTPPLAAAEIAAQGEAVSDRKNPENSYWLWSLLGGVVLIAAAYLIGR